MIKRGPIHFVIIHQFSIYWPMKGAIHNIILIVALLAVSNSLFAQRKGIIPAKHDQKLSKELLLTDKNKIRQEKERKALENKLGRPVTLEEWQQWYQHYTSDKKDHFAYHTSQGQVHTKHRGCGFIEANNWNDPQVKEALKVYEQTLQQKIQARKAQGLAGRTTGEVYQIPVVVHIIHNGEPIGEGTNISAAQVYSQIDVLNEDFRKLNADASNVRPAFADIQADAEIEFVIALEDEDGNPLPEPGITRTQGTQTTYSTPEFDALEKARTQFDPTRYANFWTASALRSNNGQVILGYGQFPDNAGVDGIPFAGAAIYDGVVMGYQYFGSLDKVVTPQLISAGAFAYGRTTTHEVGHWLGLRHISGDGGGDCSLDDYVSDTPEQADQRYNCPAATATSCGSLDMHENFMDYVDDRCMNSFSQGQVDRMRTVIENAPMRDALVNSDVAVATAGLTVAAFTSTTNQACVATPVVFSSLSTVILSDNKEITDLTWTFEGGSPATAIGDNVEVTYAALGSYDVTLYATSAAGIDTIIINDYMSIVELNASSETFPLTADFETGGIPPTGWSADQGWGLSTTVGLGSTRSAVMDNFNLNLTGRDVFLRSPVMDPSAVDGIKISFDVAYAYFDGFLADNYDSLQVGYVNPCSGIETILWKEGGESLATADPTGQVFIPVNNSEWKSVELYIDNLENEDIVQFFIQGIGGNGNRIYIDNLIIENVVGSFPTFSSNFIEHCAGSPVNYIDESIIFGNPSSVSWFWEFAGATPSSSTAQNPTGIVYDTPGFYDAKLTVTTSTGGAQTLTIPDYIHITDPFVGTSTTLNEGFEGVSTHELPNEWRFSGNIGWGVQEVGAYGQSANSVRANNHGSEANPLSNPLHSRLYSPIMDNSNTTKHLKVSFDYAYSTRLSFIQPIIDSLTVSYTTDCGENKVPIFKDGGVSMMTQDPSFLPFIPEDGEWRSVTYFITDATFDNIQLYFDLESYGGGNLYIDNISIEPIGDVVANFEVNVTESCTDVPIQLASTTEVLSSSIVSYIWDVPGAEFLNGTTATDSAIIISYPTEGTYSAQLIVESATGDKDTITVVDLFDISVFGSTVDSLDEGFESFGSTDDFPLNGWETRGDNRGWDKATVGAYGESSFSAVSPNYDVNLSGQKLILRSPIMNRPTGAKHLELTFDYAYAPLNFFGQFADSLEVRYTSNCRESFVTLFRDSGFEFATGDMRNGRFIPTADEWGSMRLFIPNAAFDEVQFDFVVTSEYANNLFIDNVKVREVSDLVLDFESNTERTCPDVPIELASTTSVLDGSITNYLWTIDGATFVNGTSATDSAIQVLFTNPGIYAVKLAVTNSLGLTEELELTDLIEVVDVLNAPNNLVDDFEMSLSTKDWTTESNAFGISSATSAYGNGSQSLRIENFGRDYEEQQVLTSAILNTEGIDYMKVEFDLAYAGFQEVNSTGNLVQRFDSLEIWFTPDCEQSFYKLWEGSGQELATADPTGGAFIPSSSQWAHHTAYLDDLRAVNSVRIYIVSKGDRANNYYVDNFQVVETDGIVANFTSSAVKPSGRIKACIDQKVMMDNLSRSMPFNGGGENITTYNWVIEGATYMDGTSATDANPIVQFSTAGTYDAQLIISSTSYADTVEVENYITVVPFTGNSSVLTEGFQSETLFRQSDWELYNEDEGWLMTSNYGGYGQSAGSIVALSYNQLVDETIEMVSPTISFDGMKHLEFSMDYAYALRVGANPDSLEIAYSLDCGDSYTTVFAKSGSEIATAAPSAANGLLLPGSTDWGTIVIDLDSVNLDQTHSGVQFAIRDKSQGGNLMWFDNIRINVFEFTAPVPDFKVATYDQAVDTGSVLVGETVSFIDYSLNKPRQWNWEFEGVTPQTSTAQNPSVVYAEAGLYKVTLTATNPGGSNTLPKTNYVKVIAPKSDADTLDNTVGNPIIDKVVDQGGTWGYIAGHNSFEDARVAEKFKKPGAFNQLEQIGLGFEAVHVGNTSNTITVNVWEVNSSGQPSNMIATTTINTQDAADKTTNNEIVWVALAEPIKITSDFFVGIEMDYTSGDTVGLKMDEVPAGQNSAWTGLSNNQWLEFSVPDQNWGLNRALWVFPVLTIPAPPKAPVANFHVDGLATSLDTFEIEMNSTVNLIDDSEEEPTEWNWTFSGANIASSTLQNPSISFADTGVYEVTLSVTNETGSDDITKYIKVVIPTGLIDNYISRSITLFPNPANNKVQLVSKTIQLKGFAVHNLMGQVIAQGEGSTNSPQQLVVDVSKLPIGIYLIKVETNEGTGIKKLLIKR